MFKFFRFGSAPATSSVLSIILGLILLIFPGISGAVFCWILAGAAFLSSAIRLRIYFNEKRSAFPFGCVLMAILGLICLFKAELVLSLLPMALGAVLLLLGIGKIPVALEMYREKMPSYILAIASTVVVLLLGIILIANPFGAAKAVIMFFGLSLVISAISDLSTASAYKNR